MILVFEFFPEKIIFQNNLITKNFDFSSLMWVFSKLNLRFYWFLISFRKKIIAISKSAIRFYNRASSSNKIGYFNFDVGAMFLTILIFPPPRNGFLNFEIFPPPKKKYTTYIHDWIQLFPKQMGFLTWIFLPQENNTYQNWIF